MVCCFSMMFAWRIKPGDTAGCQSQGNKRIGKNRLNDSSAGRVLIGMKKNLLTVVGAAAIALGLGACAYDPNYYGNTRSSVSVGYGYGHGYGGSSFSTSFFWSTGDPRWGYDPYARAYYDHHRRAYYDPYLYGYYPIGYRPPILIGVPHPYGYRQGWCPPPRRITNVTVVNYRNRESAYRNTDHGWARNVRYDSRQQTSTTTHRNRNDVRSNNETRNRDDIRNRDETRNRDGTRNRNDTTSWGGRTPSSNDRDFSPTTTRDARTHIDAPHRTTTRSVALQPAVRSAPEPRRQSVESETGNRRGVMNQNVEPRGQRSGAERADWGRRQAQTPTAATQQRGRPEAGRMPQAAPTRSPDNPSSDAGRRSRADDALAQGDRGNRGDGSNRGGRR